MAPSYNPGPLPPPSKLLGPVLPPPPGVVSNFHAYNYREHYTVNAVIACTVLAVSFVVMRLWTKVFVTRQLWWDDYTCVVALLFVAAYSGGAIMQTHNGEGLHLWDVQLKTWLENYNTGFQIWNVASYAIYMVAMCFTKLSILLLYLKLLAPGMKLRFAVYGILAFVATYSIAMELSLLFACNPIMKLYHSYLHGSCSINIIAHGLTQGILNIISDFLIIIVPIPMVWSIQMSTKHKVGVIGIFATGLVVTALSMYRLYTLIVCFNHLDVTYIQWGDTIVSLIEINLAVIVTCMPSFKPFLRHVVPWIHTKSTSSPSSPAIAGHSRPSFVRSISKPSNPVHTANSKESAFIYLEGGSDRNVSLASSSDAEKAHDGNNGRVSSVEETRGFR